MDESARLRRARGQAAEAEVEAALADELSYLPKKEHRRKQTEFTERARRAARRAETAGLDHALQLAGLWYRDLACLAADAEELVLACDRLEKLRADAGGRDAPRSPPPSTSSRTRAHGCRTTSPTTSRCRRSPTGSSACSRSLLSRHDRSPRPRRVRERRGPGIEDEVAVEEPLEIRVDGAPIAVTMRTPGEDEELALGFLHGEGLIDGPHDAGPPADLASNTVEVGRSAAARAGVALVLRHLLLRRVREGRARGGRRPRAAGRRRPADRARLLADLPDRLRQPTFSRTGGLHATGLFSAAGEPLIVREDVGRHNAMDKVIGRALLDGLLPLDHLVLCVSGRLSFELVQKAAVAGAPVLVGVGAPSSLAVRLADDRNMTLAGFARRGRVNVYTGAHRVT